MMRCWASCLVVLCAGCVVASEMGTLDAVPSPQEAALFAEVGESHKAAGDVQLLQDRLGGTALPANPARTLAPGSNQTKTMASPQWRRKRVCTRSSLGDQWVIS